MKYLFIITGPSGCGKTTLLKNLDKDFNHKTGLWEKASKLSTRSPRKGERDIGGYWDVETPDIAPDDSPEEVLRKKEEMRKRIRLECDILYYMNNELYGFNTSLIKDQLESEHVAIVLSDLGVIKTLKENHELRDRIVTLYISSTVDSAQLTDVWIHRYQDFNGNKKDEVIDAAKNKDVGETLEIVHKNIEHLSKLKDQIISNDEQGYQLFFSEYYPAIKDLFDCCYDLMPDGDSYKVRIDRLKNFYYKYILDIGLFNYVVLNYFDSNDKPENEQMSRQARNLIKYLEERAANGNPLLFSHETRPKDAIFFICAAPKSGKRILQSNLSILSSSQIHNVSKAALRKPKGNEDDNAMFALIRTPEDERKTNGFLREDKQAYNSYKKTREDLAARAKESSDSIEKTICEETIFKLDKEERLRWNEARDFFPAEYQEWIWRFHGKFYGVNTGEIENYSKVNRLSANEPIIPIIMISNMYELDEAYRRYPDRIVPVFMTFVSTDSGNEAYHLSQVGDDDKHMYKTEAEARATIDEIKAIKEEYYNNIGKFKHVLLNSGVEEDLHDQIINLVRLYHN